jgi:hypothetical protein
MLGLSLAIRVGKRVLGSLIDSLMSAVKGRATYSENIADSKQVVKDIDNYELLDKASILLTPTAYSDARVHSVKTYTGDELVVNGGFDADSDWTKGTGWSIANGKASNDGSSGSNNLTQGGVLVVGKNYKITITVSDYVSGNVEVSAGAAPRNTMSANGTYTFYQTCTPATSFYIIANAFEGSIDNVSVSEADADFDFDRASSATRINSDGLVQDMQSITDVDLVQNGDFEELGDDAVTNGTFDTDSGWFKSSQSTISNGTARILSTDGSYQYISQTKIEYTNTQSKYVKITLDIVNYVSGTLKAQFSGGTSYSFPTSVGTHTIYVLNDGSSGTFNLARVAGVTDITVDNVSVQQVDPNDRWSAGAKWTIANGVARLVSSDSSGSGFIQSSVFTIGNTYNITFDAVVVSGSAKVEALGGATLIEIDETKTYNHTFVADRTDLYFNRVTSVSDISLDNISVKDITFSEDVDLARINYDSNGENGHWLLEPTSTNEITYSEDFSQTIWTKNDVLVEGGYTAPDGSNTAYKVTNDGGNAHLVGYYNINTGKRKSIWAKTVSGTGDVDLLNQNGNNLFTLTNEWQRFDATHAGAANFFYAVDFRGASTTLSEVIVWGCQLEDLSYATSYIPTYGSTVTRATETLRNSGNSTLINSTEGVLYVEALMQDTGAFKTAARITATDTSTTDGLWIYFRNDNSIQSVLRVGGVDQTGINSSVKTTNEYYKVAFKYKENDFALWVDGVEVATDTSGNTFSAGTLSNLGFVLATNTNPFYGKVKALAVFDEALTDDELELLTGITNYGSFNELAQANGYTII